LSELMPLACCNAIGYKWGRGDPELPTQRTATVLHDRNTQWYPGQACGPVTTHTGPPPCSGRTARHGTARLGLASPEGTRSRQMGRGSKRELEGDIRVLWPRRRGRRLRGLPLRSDMKMHNPPQLVVVPASPAGRAAQSWLLRKHGVDTAPCEAFMPTRRFSRRVGGARSGRCSPRWS